LHHGGLLHNHRGLLHNDWGWLHVNWSRYCIHGTRADIHPDGRPVIRSVIRAIIVRTINWAAEIDADTDVCPGLGQWSSQGYQDSQDLDPSCTHRRVSLRMLGTVGSAS
jgi:hypothetical protein